MFKVGDKVLISHPIVGICVRVIDAVMEDRLGLKIRVCYSVDGYIYFREEITPIPSGATIEQVKALVKLCQNRK